jgi:NAD(P)H-dependent flavin oxidoreductase YrpB (nitropropane dioxygenase family)
VNTALNRARRDVSVPESDAAPAARPDRLNDAIEVVLDERVPVWSVGLGLPSADLVARGHDRGVHVMCMIANVDVRAPPTWRGSTSS